jgi:rod shape-determining protein MreC
MHWIFGFIFHYRGISSLALTVILSLWMINASTVTQDNIARSLTLSVFYPLQATIEQITRVRNIFAENRRLKERVTRLQTSVAMLREQTQENDRLRALLEFEESYPHELLAARVIAREPSAMYRSIVVSVGSRHKLQAHMPVVNNDGVVGRIVQCMPNISLVQLLKDPSARTGVMVSRSRQVGILETENGRTFFISYRTHADIAQGDTVITSGLGGIYPKGLPVGTIQSVKDGNDPLFKKAYLDPFADFERLEEVFIIKRKPQWAAFRQELDSLVIETK